MSEMFTVEAKDLLGLDPLAEVLVGCLQHMSACDIVRVSACSKATKEIIAGYLSDGDHKLARNLLRGVLQAAGMCTEIPELQLQHNCVQWILNTSNIPRETLEHDNWFRYPRVPPGICDLLVAAGVRINYQQLVSAARDCVEGVGNWVRACFRQNVETDISPLVKEVCCGSCYEDRVTLRLSQSQHQALWQNLNSETLKGILMIALNDVSDTCSQDRPQHCAGEWFWVALEMAPVAQNLSSEVCFQLLQCLLECAKQQRSCDALIAMTPFIANFGQIVSRLPGVRHMTAGHIEELFLSAMQVRNIQLHLISLPGAQLLSTDQVTTLLTAVLRHKEHLKVLDHSKSSTFEHLCQLPAAALISSDVCRQIFELYVNMMDSNTPDNGNVLMAFWLRTLTGMQQMSSAGVMGLIISVLQLDVSSSRNIGMMKDLGNALQTICSLPAATDISVSDVQQLFQMAEGRLGVKRTACSDGWYWPYRELGKLLKHIRQRQLESEGQ